MLLLRRFFFSLALLFACSMVYGQQSAQFSQYQFNELYVNPGYAGYKGELYAHALYRSQWSGLSGAPRTFVLGVDDMVSSRLNLGLQVFHDRIGQLNTTSILGSYAYQLQLTREHELRLGLSLGVQHQGLNAGALEGSDPTVSDPLVATGTFTSWSPDAAVGVYFSSPRWFAGVSAVNLIAGTVGSATGKGYQLPQQKPTLMLQAGFLAYLSRDVKLKPSFLYKDDFKGPSSLDLSAMFLFLNDRLWLGASYRSGLMLWKGKRYDDADVSSFDGNTLSLLIDVFATDRIRVGYAYDYSFTALSSAYSSSHEVSLGFYLTKVKRRVYSPRYF